MTFEALLPSLLSAVYGHVDGKVTLTADTDDGLEEVTASAAAPFLLFIMGSPAHVYASLNTTDEFGGICLAFKDRARATAVADKLDPSFVITSASSVRLIYLIEPEEGIANTLADLQEFDDDDAFATDEFPLPYEDYSLSPDDEKIITSGKDLTVYTLHEFEVAMFSDGTEDDPDPVVADEGLSSELDAGPTSTMNDAEVYGELPSAVLGKVIRVSTGRSQDEKVWTTSPEAPFGVFLENWLTKHTVGQKDGTCFVTGAVADKRRNKNSVLSLYMLGLDVDSGASMADTFRRVRERDLMAVFYTTHSHGTTEIRVKQDKFYKWAEQQAENPEPDDQTVKKYLTNEGKYTDDVIASATYEDTVHDSTGMHLIIRTRPIDKFRIIFLLEEPYVIAKQSMAQRDAINQWESLVLGMGLMLGISVDRAARDPSRLFFYPRHKKGTNSHRIMVSAGKPLDWTTIKKLDPREKVTSDPFDQAANVMGGRLKGRTMSPVKGIDLQTWASERADGFMISKVFEDHCSDRLREETGPSKFTCECPFDDDHSNSGDPDDKGCYIEDAGINAETFAFRCRHDSCSGRDRLQMLEKAMIDGWFPDDVLSDNTYDCVDREETEEVVDEDTGEKTEEPKHKNTVAEYNRAMVMAENLKSDSSTDDIRAVLSVCLPLSTFDKQRIIKHVESKTKVGIPQLQRLLKTMESEDPQKVDDVAYDPAKLAADTKRRFATLRKDKRPVVISNEAQQPSSTKHLIETLTVVNEGRPEQRVKTREGEEIIPAVEPAYVLFRYGDNKVRITKSKDGRYMPENLDKAVLRDIVQEHVRLVSLTDSSAFEDVFAPDWMAEQAVTNNQLGLLPLDGFANLPYFNRERQLVMTPGYDRFSAKILKMQDDIAKMLTAENQKIIKHKPTEADVEHALHELFGYCFIDFPFDDGPDALPETNGEASRAHLLCMMLQPLIRDLIDGPTPLYLVDKPAAGTGASLLVSAAMTISLGETPPTKAMPDSEEELRKTISAGYFSGDPCMFFDNVNHPLVSGFYANMATAPVWQDRFLGKSETTSVKNTMLNIFAGNNMRTSEENARRALLIRMDAKRDPTMRKIDFKCKDLMQHVRENKIELYGCLLTLINYWLSNGARIWEGEPLASFENFCKVMGGILEACDMPGFLGNRSLTSNANSVDRMAWNQFIRALKKKHDKDNTPWVPISEITNFYTTGMSDAPTLVVNGGGRVTPFMDENKVYGAMQVIIDRQLGQVFTIMTDSGDEIEVMIQRKLDKKESKTFYGIVDVRAAEEEAA